MTAPDRKFMELSPQQQWSFPSADALIDYQSWLISTIPSNTGMLNKSALNSALPSKKQMTSSIQ
jgi:hypothetical protein